MSEENDKEIHKLGRRDFMKLAGGAVAIGGLATGGWFVTELIVDEGDVDKWHKSVCRYCGTGCGVMLGMSKENQLVRVRGDQEAHNKGVICIKGSTLSNLMKQEDRRIKYPMIRKNGKLERATWDEALSLMADKFKEALAENGPESVGYYGSGQLLIEESYTANKLFKAGFKSNNVDGNPRLCMASAAVGYTQTFGKDEPPGCYEDMDHADCFFLIGSNTYEGHPPLWERIMIRKKSHPNTKIIVVDPRYTKTAEKADIHLPVVPGTDMLLLNSMMYCFIEQDLCDTDFISKNVTFNDGKSAVDFEKFKLFLEDYKPEKVADELGLTPRQIRTAAYWFGASKATMSMWTMGINQRAQGVFLNNNLNSMHLLTGQINRPGATPLSLTGQSNACGGVRDTGSLSHLLPNGRLVANPTHRAEMEKLWKVPAGTINPKPGYHALAMFQAMVDEKLKACLIMCTNPAQSLPNNDHYREGMKKSFLAVADIFETETTKFADVVLPAALYIEKEGVYGQTERRYQIIEKLVDPVGEAKSDLEILVEFAKKMGQDKLITAHTSEEVWEEYRELSSHSKYNFKGITRERLKKERGIQWPCPDENHPGTKRRYTKGDPFVPEGKDHYFYGKPDGKAVVFLRPYKRVKEVTSTTKPLYLTTGRVVSQWHTGTMTGGIKELNIQSGGGRFIMHPEDARRLKLKKGDLASVQSTYGTITGHVDISENETPGVVFASFYDPKFLVNKIVNDDYDPISKEPVYKVTAVNVSKATSLDRKK
ncbi:molybdopterin oxidoreductase family protein [Sediminitomix flava]|uniref:Periplasmic nitrate reductase subunit NapA apoprotein n=1 Tax=Sediminitomix flava TaxID=379075 RepID=A0A315ZET0_SEDFL|nr:nitrate reductase [Sediminitomix flava]PWJ43338.1 periplasmic nitrate reductase subunit NapA apoprotein [Sediminitomix flava]